MRREPLSIGLAWRDSVLSTAKAPYPGCRGLLSPSKWVGTAETLPAEPECVSGHGEGAAVSAGSRGWTACRHFQAVRGTKMPPVSRLRSTPGSAICGVPPGRKWRHGGLSLQWPCDTVTSVRPRPRRTLARDAFARRSSGEMSASPRGHSGRNPGDQGVAGRVHCPVPRDVQPENVIGRTDRQAERLSLTCWLPGWSG